MSTKPYTQSTPSITYPLVLFARTRKKNTAELTASELRQFLRWSWKFEPIRNGLCNMPEVRKRYWEKTAHATSIIQKEKR